MKINDTSPRSYQHSEPGYGLYVSTVDDQNQRNGSSCHAAKHTRILTNLNIVACIFLSIIVVTVVLSSSNGFNLKITSFVGKKEESVASPITIDEVERKERVFLHISDTHADPYYNYKYYWESASKISRDPKLFSKAKPAKKCGDYSDSVQSIIDHWNITSNPGKSCPCGHYGANPPFSVIDALSKEIEKQNPEFIVWGGDFTSHYEPGTAVGDSCRTAKLSAMASVSILNVKHGSNGNPIQHLWVFGNNDVLPKKQPLTQDWLEEFGQHLVRENWLSQEEYDTTWIYGGYYKRNLGKGLCVLNLNSNSWTVGQINVQHHHNQVSWLRDKAFVDDTTCNEYLINAHVPLGWLRTGRGHHKWTNLQDVVAHEYCEEYRNILDKKHKTIIAELNGHINKADVRLIGKGTQNTTNTSGQTGDEIEIVTEIKPDEEKKDNFTDEGKDPTLLSGQGDLVGDLDENIGDDARIVSFTVAGISRRANNDPQFQRITLEPTRKNKIKKHDIKDIEVYSMKGNDCGDTNAFTYAYSFRTLFTPDFDAGINVDTVLDFIENDKVQRDRIEKHLALSSMPYTKDQLSNNSFLDAVRSGIAGCERDLSDNIQPWN